MKSLGFCRYYTEALRFSEFCYSPFVIQSIFHLKVLCIQSFFQERLAGAAERKLSMQCPAALPYLSPGALNSCFLAIYLYAGRTILPEVIYSSMRCAHQPGTRAMVKRGVYISVGMPSMR